MKRSMRSNISWTACLCSAWLVACAGTQSLTPSRGPVLDATEAAEALRALEVRSEKTATVRASGTLSGQWGKQSGAFAFALVLSRPDMLRFDLLDPAAGRVGTLIYYGEYFYWHAPRERRLYRMPVEPASLRRLSRLELAPEQLVHLFAGLPPSKPTAWIRKGDGRLITPDQRGEAVFNAQAQLTDYRYYRDKSRAKLATLVTFDRYRQVAGIDFPGQITLRSADGARLHIAYDTIEVNVTLAGEAFRLVVPADTEVVQW